MARRVIELTYAMERKSTVEETISQLAEFECFIPTQCRPKFRLGLIEVHADLMRQVLFVLFLFAFSISLLNFFLVLKAQTLNQIL